jgi:hypothetical protein
MPINGIETAYKDRYTFAPLSQRSAQPVQWYTLPPRFILGVSFEVSHMCVVRLRKDSVHLHSQCCVTNPALEASAPASLSDRVLVSPVALKLQDKLSRSACPGARNFHDFPPLPR